MESQHQNSYRFITSHIEVFSCVFRHDYYENRLCNDLTFQPTPQTSSVIKNYNLIFKTRSGGFALAANGTSDFMNPVYMDPFDLDFEFKFTNPYFHSFTVLESDPEVRYFLDDSLEPVVELGAKQGTIDAALEKTGVSGVIRIKHVPKSPILPLIGSSGRFQPRSKEVNFINRLIRPVYLCYCSQEKVSEFQGLSIISEGEFKGVVEFGLPELVTTDSGLIAFKFIAKQNIPMKLLWKGYFRLERSNQLGIYKKTLPNPSAKSIKFDFKINAHISENFVKL